MILKGKTVFVTGSSRGIGKAIAFLFASENCNVILNSSSSEQELINTHNEFKSQGFNCSYYLGDVSDYNICKNIFKKITDTFGGVDILINNAGTSYIGLFGDMKPKQWENIIGVNLYSVFNCTHLSLPYMINKKNGVIINISSMWGEKGASCESIYSASKGGINSFTKSMAKELGPSGIRVNAISCGVIDTKMNEWLTDTEKEDLKEEISLMRFGKIEEVAQLAVFLAGNKSEYITGQIVSIDGGIV